jgi:hypothetical protein
LIIDGNFSNRRLLATSFNVTFFITLSSLLSDVGTGAHQSRLCVVQSGNGRISNGPTIYRSDISSPAAIFVRGNESAYCGLSADGQDSSGANHLLTMGNDGFTAEIIGLTSGITMARHWVQITESVVLLVVRLANGNSGSSSMNITKYWVCRRNTS